MLLLKTAVAGHGHSGVQCYKASRSQNNTPVNMMCFMHLSSISRQACPAQAQRGGEFDMIDQLLTHHATEPTHDTVCDTPQLSDTSYTQWHRDSDMWPMTRRYLSVSPQWWRTHDWFHFLGGSGRYISTSLLLLAWAVAACFMAARRSANSFFRASSRALAAWRAFCVRSGEESGVSLVLVGLTVRRFEP